MKKISIAWGICVVLIFTGLTVLGFFYKDIRPYDELKNKMLEYAEKYIEEKEDFKLKEKDTYKITISELSEKYQDISFIVNDDKCNGEVVVSNGLFGYKYKANIKCEKYPKK